MAKLAIFVENVSYLVRFLQVVQYSTKSWCCRDKVFKEKYLGPFNSHEIRLFSCRCRQKWVYLRRNYGFFLPIERWSIYL